MNGLRILDSYQDDLGHDEVCKVFKDYEIIVKYEISGAKIKTNKFHNYTEGQILNNLTTKQHFVETYMEVMQQFKEQVYGRKKIGQQITNI